MDGAGSAFSVILCIGGSSVDDSDSATREFICRGRATEWCH